MIVAKDNIQQFQKIIFQPCDDSQLNRLTQQEKDVLRTALGQKIAYEAVYKRSYPQQEIEIPQHQYHAPNIFANICCFFYPEYYKDQFSITASLFKKRFFGSFLFWREDFLQLTEKEKQQPKLLPKKQEQEPKQEKRDQNLDKTTKLPQLFVVKEIRHSIASEKQETKQNEQMQEKRTKGPDLYGPLWLTVTYIILLALCANLNDYFSAGSKPNFAFKKDYLSNSLAMVIFLSIAEIIIYAAVVGCLDGQMSNTQSAYLIGYSLSLYFVPTILCVWASKYIHIFCLLIAGLLRFVFLGKNYTSRLLQRKSICYTVILGGEALYFFMVSATFFSNYYVGPPNLAVSKTTHFLRTFLDQSLKN